VEEIIFFIEWLLIILKFQKKIEINHIILNNLLKLLKIKMSIENILQKKIIKTNTIFFKRNSSTKSSKPSRKLTIKFKNKAILNIN
jgi:hypothetical protein